MPVESLDDTVLAPCDLTGSAVVFPDGYILEVLGGTGSASGYTAEGALPSYSYYNVGIYGIVAAKTDAEGLKSEWWGRATAIERVQNAFGEVAN